MSQNPCPKCKPSADPDYVNQCLCPPQPGRMSRTFTSRVATAVATADLDQSIYRAGIAITCSPLTPVFNNGALTIDEAMQLRDVLSRAIHAALSMTADLNARNP